MPETGDIYFVGAPNDLVKIGFAARLERRVAALRAGSPVPLELLGNISDCTRRHERVLHVEFEGQRQHGEWFRRVPKMDELAELNTAADLEWRLGVQGPALGVRDTPHPTANTTTRTYIKRCLLEGASPGMVAISVGWPGPRLKREIIVMERLGFFTAPERRRLVNLRVLTP